MLLVESCLYSSISMTVKKFNRYQIRQHSELYSKYQGTVHLLVSSLLQVHNRYRNFWYFSETSSDFNSTQGDKCIIVEHQIRTFIESTIALGYNQSCDLLPRRHIIDIPASSSTCGDGVELIILHPHTRNEPCLTTRKVCMIALDAMAMT